MYDNELTTEYRVQTNHIGLFVYNFSKEFHHTHLRMELLAKSFWEDWCSLLQLRYYYQHKSKSPRARLLMAFSEYLPLYLTSSHYFVELSGNNVKRDLEGSENVHLRHLASGK